MPAGAGALAAATSCTSDCGSEYASVIRSRSSDECDPAECGDTGRISGSLANDTPRLTNGLAADGFDSLELQYGKKQCLETAYAGYANTIRSSTPLTIGCSAIAVNVTRNELLF